MASIDIPNSLVKTLHNARHVAVLTGAGISAESGVPTFRDAQTGLWSRYRPEELATPEAFQHNPKLVWDWYAWRRDLVGRVAPNAGHYALVRMEQRIPVLTLITQNVDGLHRRAGSHHVLELHGNLFRAKCLEEGRVLENWREREETPPRCTHCGAWLRPDVVWFGEMLPSDVLREAEEATVQCDVFFSIGTSTLVYPAAELPFAALRSGSTVVEVNPQPTPLSDQAHYSLRGAAGEVLPGLLEKAWGESIRD
jgi:NAD-dependent deacetylase